MPWEERKVSHVREEFVKRVLAQEASKSALCREYGISRQASLAARPHQRFEKRQANDMWQADYKGHLL